MLDSSFPTRPRTALLAPLLLALLGACGSSSPAGGSSDAGTSPDGSSTTSDAAGATLDGGDGSVGLDGGVPPCNVLTPAPSSLYVLVDSSSGMRDFLGEHTFAQIIAAYLASPILAQASVALMFTPASPSDCSSAANAFATPGGTGVPFESAGKAATDIEAQLLHGNSDGGALPAGSSPWYLEAALAGAYSALEAQTAPTPLNRRAALLLLDRDFAVSPPDCAGHADAIAEATAALSANGVETYVIYLGNADYPDGGVPGDPVAHAQALGHALAAYGTPFVNASQSMSAAAFAGSALAAVNADLGSCLYETPAALPQAATLTFQDYAPLLQSGTPATVSVAQAASCAGDDAVASPLYVLEGGQIQLCPSTCQRLYASLVTDQQVTAMRNATVGAAQVPLLSTAVSWVGACAAADN